MINTPALSPFDEPFNDPLIDPVDTAMLHADHAPSADPQASTPPVPARTRKPRKSASKPEAQAVTVQAGTHDVTIRLVVDNGSVDDGATRPASSPRHLGGFVRGPSGLGDVEVAAPPMARVPAAQAAPLPVPPAAAAAAPMAMQPPSAKTTVVAAQPVAQPGVIVIHVPAKTVVLMAWSVIIVGFLALLGGGL